MNDVNEAIRLNPKEATAYFTRGLIWQAKLSNDEASKDFKEAARLDPPYYERVKAAILIRPR